MASKSSYTITLSNNKTEKEAIDYLLESNPDFLLPNRESKLLILEKLNLPSKYVRTFDLIMVKNHTNRVRNIQLLESDEILLVELKKTKKKLPNMSKGFFFGATQSELDLAELMGDKYLFCFVCLYTDYLSYKLMPLAELNSIIVSKRIQYQINL